MLIRDHHTVDVLLSAREEMSSLFDREPSPSFYDTKLARVWERARRTAAYAALGPYSRGAFESLPMTSKDALKASPWSFMAVDLDSAAKYYETTGTSGLVTPTPRLTEDVVWNAASVAEAWGRTIGPGDRVAVLLPSDVVPVADLVVGVCELLGVPHTRLYPFATGVTGWDRLLDLWRTLRPTAVFVAPGVALQLTRLLKQRGLLDEVTGTVRTLMLLGEVSTPALRRRLGAWWGAAAHDASFGSTETGTLAATCGSGNLHLLRSANHFELATDDGVVPLSGPGSGRLVVTPLNLHARPLLRFDTGDVVDVGGCDCGRPAPMITVRGRSSDGVAVAGVELTIGAVEQVVYGVTNATGYQVEVDAAGRHGRLLLERDTDQDRTAEPEAVEAVQAASERALGLRWDAVRFVNALPAITKSGGSQKSWKRSNIRVLEAAS